MSINDYLFKYMSYVTKNFAFIVSPVLRCQILIQLISQYQTVIRILILKIEMLLEFQNKTNIEIIGF